MSNINFGVLTPRFHEFTGEEATTMKTFAEFIAWLHIEFKATSIACRTDGAQIADKNARHFLCVLRSSEDLHRFHGIDASGIEFVIEFTQGSGVKNEPEARDVLGCLATDFQAVRNTETFEEWANELGLDTDSRSAEKTYRAIKDQMDRFKDVFGKVGLDALIAVEEQL